MDDRRYGYRTLFFVLCYREYDVEIEVTDRTEPRP